VRATTTLQTRDELQEDSVDSVAEAAFVPLHFAGVFFALVEEQSFHDVRCDGVAGEVQVTVAESLKDAEAALSEATWRKIERDSLLLGIQFEGSLLNLSLIDIQPTLKQLILSFHERQNPSVALHRTVLSLQRDALLRKHVKSFSLNFSNNVRMRPRNLR
jgi:hypothetical protein